MDPIRTGMKGLAVEDVQTRLGKLGFQIDDAETRAKEFGPSTGRAVAAFRASEGLDAGDEVDLECWSALVDASYRMGDRTLYLRLPNFHGHDVTEVQHALNVLGFACGEEDGQFGPHTEAALQQFQENIGLFPDGMAFQDTFAAIKRLRHVWAGKTMQGSHSAARTGFARAASVLEGVRIAVRGSDPIARSVAARMWNIASATTVNSGLVLCEGECPADADLFLDMTDAPLEKDSAPQARIALTGIDTDISSRLKAAYGAATAKPVRVRIELSALSRYNGTFTANDAQTLAVHLLDAVCEALS